MCRGLASRMDASLMDRRAIAQNGAAAALPNHSLGLAALRGHAFAVHPAAARPRPALHSELPAGRYGAVASVRPRERAAGFSNNLAFHSEARFPKLPRPPPAVAPVAQFGRCATAQPQPKRSPSAALSLFAVRSLIIRTTTRAEQRSAARRHGRPTPRADRLFAFLPHRTAPRPR